MNLNLYDRITEDLFALEASKAHEFDLFERAEQRVLNSPNLEPYKDILLAWTPEGDDHWEWIIASEEEELLKFVAFWIEGGRPI